VNTHFVYLHIPKSAGTSQRILLYENYGESNVYWYGINSDCRKFHARKVAAYPVVGGHRRRSFYNGSRASCFFSSVVREPVSRAISLFNFFASHTSATKAAWIKKGFHPESMLRTIENCPAFVKHIRNMQCRFLSGWRRFDSTVARLGKVPCAVGVLDNLTTYNEKLASLFGWISSEAPRVLCGETGYEEAIREEPGLIAAVKRLNREDLHLYAWLQDQGVWVNDRDLKKFQERLGASPERARPVDRILRRNSAA